MYHQYYKCNNNMNTNKINLTQHGNLNTTISDHQYWQNIILTQFNQSTYQDMANKLICPCTCSSIHTHFYRAMPWWQKPAQRYFFRLDSSGCPCTTKLALNATDPVTHFPSPKHPIYLVNLWIPSIYRVAKPLGHSTRDTRTSLSRNRYFRAL